jgi:hypothetical protein
VTDYVAPALRAGLFVLTMSSVQDPTRRTLNALIVAGASGVDISGGDFGTWECSVHSSPCPSRHVA